MLIDVIANDEADGNNFTDEKGKTGLLVSSTLAAVSLESFVTEVVEKVIFKGTRVESKTKVLILEVFNALTEVGTKVEKFKDFKGRAEEELTGLLGKGKLEDITCKNEVEERITSLLLLNDGVTVFLVLNRLEDVVKGVKENATIGEYIMDIWDSLLTYKLWEAECCFETIGYDIRGSLFRGNFIDAVREVRECECCKDTIGVDISGVLLTEKLRGAVKEVEKDNIFAEVIEVDGMRGLLLGNSIEEVGKDDCCNEMVGEDIMVMLLTTKCEGLG